MKKIEYNLSVLSVHSSSKCKMISSFSVAINLIVHHITEILHPSQGSNGMNGHYNGSMYL